MSIKMFPVFLCEELFVEKEVTEIVEKEVATYTGDLPVDEIRPAKTFSARSDGDDCICRNAVHRECVLIAEQA